MTSDQSTIAQWLRRIEMEYQEMPGLCLNKCQMQRLWGLESFVCDALVDALVAARVLRRTSHHTNVVH
jgi:hypothetical protein